MARAPRPVVPHEYEPLPKAAQNLVERTEMLERGYYRFAQNCARNDDYWHAGQVMVMLAMMRTLQSMMVTINAGLKGERPKEDVNGIRQSQGDQTVAFD